MRQVFPGGAVLAGGDEWGVACRPLAAVLEESRPAGKGDPKKGTPEGLTPPFEAFQGLEPFGFVSYAHRDAALVYPEIDRLHRMGYRLWYDEGICPGGEWPEEIGRALTQAAFFMVFISPRALASKNVRNEINMALAKDKPFLAIYLEETELSAGMELQIGSLQAILKHRLDETRFRRRLEGALPTSLRQSG
jgi:hypothetical protein